MGITPQLRCRLFACVLVGLLGWVAGHTAPAHAQFVLENGYATSPIGPTRALGAVIWNHGKSSARGTETDMLPFYLDRLRDAGWDVFRLERDWASDDLVYSPAALRDKIGELYGRGYRKLVLAGQSYGAWIALMVAASGTPIHAVIATAPAAFGRYPDSPIFRDNADQLYPMLARIRGRTRVMMFLFEDDEFDPGNRGAPAHAILERNGVENAVIAYPHGWNGHGAANWNGFATRFGPCITRFVDPRREGEARCDRDPVTRETLLRALPDVLRQRALPEELRPAGLKPATGAADGLAGLWYGVYANGREALLSLDPPNRGEVTALYGWGLQERDEPDAPGHDTRIGRVEGDRLRFVEPDRPSLDVRPLGPDSLRLTWTSRDGTRVDSAELHRLR